MKNAVMGICTTLLLLVAVSVAQSNPPADKSTDSQGTTSSSPSMGQQPSATTDSPQGTMGNSTNANGNMKTERKMKGCIQSQGGQYVLQTKHGKDIALSGQDVSAHVGHEVAVHGMWEGAAADASNGGNMSNTSSGSASMSGKSFNVSSVDMISETCTSSKKQ